MMETPKPLAELLSLGLVYAVVAFLLVRAIWHKLGLWLFPLIFVLVVVYMIWQGRGHKAHDGE